MSLANSKTNTSTKKLQIVTIRKKNPLLTKIINNHLQMQNKKTDSKDIE